MEKVDWSNSKIDLKKSYNNVKFSSPNSLYEGVLAKTVSMGREFPDGSVAIKVNHDAGNYFQTRKDLRQGNPMSPIFLNIVVDMLAILIERAEVVIQISRVIPHVVEDDLSIL